MKFKLCPNCKSRYAAYLRWWRKNAKRKSKFSRVKFSIKGKR